MIDKEELLKPRLPEAVIEVLGGEVRVRGLSRDEVISMRKATDAEAVDGPRTLVIERKLMAVGLVDPAMTEEEIKKWQDVSPAGEIEPIVNKISELSGMMEGADKAQYKSFRDESGS